MDLEFRMHAERTPNPNSIKWVLDRPVLEGTASAHFDSRPPEEVSPLAARLFDIDGVAIVFLGSNFVTVTKREDIEWAEISQPIIDAIQACLGSEGSALGPAFDVGERGAQSEVVERIRRILDEEVRPSVAMDGGDVVFAGFRDGIVEVYLRGACSGCPGATATLKLGIEARLREEIPEVQGVMAL